MTNRDYILKSKDITLLTNVRRVFPVVMYGCESWTTKKEGWMLKNWCFQIVVWRRHLRILWITRRSNQSIPDQAGIFTGRTDADAAKKSEKWKSLIYFWLFATLYSPWNSPAHNTGVGSLYLFQKIILTQELNQGLLHHRQIPYQLSYQENPNILMLKLKL